MKVIIFSSPQRKEMLKSLRKELKGLDVTVIDNPETFGKQNFWKRYKEAFDICKASKHDNFMFIPDDISNIDLDQIKILFERFKNEKFVCSVVSDGRTSCWGNIPNYKNNFDLEGYSFMDMGFYDCGGITNRTTIDNINVDQVRPDWFTSKNKSSGVGHQLTVKFRDNNIPMFTSSPSLSYHGPHESIMHKDERAIRPLITRTKGMNVVIGIATFQGRAKYLEKTLESLKGQADRILIYDNEQNVRDLTDNGKFYGLSLLKEPCYYLTCDDDIIYPPTYVNDMIDAIDRTGGIVTHHGRILLGLDRSYYKGHEAHQCLRLNREERIIDVAGTGVTGFHTSYFNPVDIWKSKDLKMGDLVFSLEATKQGKKITLLAHEEKYIIAQDVPMSQTIYGMESNKAYRQQEIANEIYTLKHGDNR